MSYLLQSFYVEETPTKNRTKVVMAGHAHTQIQNQNDRIMTA